nr:integrase, catalytic region, zinc finger, CCHC-type, peptidase aspartic, catalytic [Tanacetum cinerariifolium]
MQLVLIIILLCLTKRTMCYGRLVFSVMLRVDPMENDKLTKKELKQIEADDQAIQTILLGLPEDIYMRLLIVTKDLHTADYTQLYDFLKYNQKEVDDLKAGRLAKIQDPLALANSNNPYAFPAPHQDQSSFNQNYMQQPMPNPEDITDLTTNGLIGVPGNGNQNGNGNLVAARVEGNAAGQKGNQIRCYNCRGEEAGIQLQAKEFDLMDAAADLDEIEEVNANCILMANLQQASTSSTQTDKAPVYDSNGSAEVIQICLWCVDSGCSKHMTGNLKLLINFVWKFMGGFGNDHVAAILGFGDLQWGNILITRVYFIEGLGHNLFSGSVPG